MDELQFQIDYVKALIEKCDNVYELEALEEELDELLLQQINQNN